MDQDNPLLTVITPAYNEEKNLPLLFKRLKAVFENEKISWEWIVVDDHSSDNTYTAMLQITKEDARVHCLRFTRNFGSHTAVTCGMNKAIGKAAIVLAADLQDPPEVIPTMISTWKNGNQVVWAVRSTRLGEKRRTHIFSRLYYFIMRRISGFDKLPSKGADFFLLDRSVIDAFCQFKEKNVSILALITWMGFQQSFISYDKAARGHGKSGWSLKKKLKLVVDSITSFTYFPIRLMSYLGFVFALIGFTYALVIIVNAFFGSPVHGWSSLMIVVLILGGAQMVMMGVLGEYLWRALDESRKRPPYLIESSTYMSSQKSNIPDSKPSC